jgi:hypothetical protein
MDGQPEVALVVERHRRELAQRVLAVEHPAVGAGEQGIGHVPDALLDGRAGLGARAGALDPLALQIERDGASGEGPPARIGDGDAGPADAARRIEEREGLFLARPRGAPPEACRHQGMAIVVERGQYAKGLHDGGGEHVGVSREGVRSDVDHA